MTNFKILAELYMSFIKIGGFTIGGGYAMIPIIQREAVDNKKWVTEEEMTDFITLGQSVPGVVGINTATAVGNKVAGAAGALSATLGMITPSLVVIIIIATVFDRLHESALLQSAFHGVRAAVVALLAMAVLRLSKNTTGTLFQMLVAAAVAFCILVFKISPPYMILTAALAGIIYRGFPLKR